jgi:hypothetical protein
MKTHDNLFVILNKIQEKTNPDSIKIMEVKGESNVEEFLSNVSEELKINKQTERLIIYYNNLSIDKFNISNLSELKVNNGELIFNYEVVPLTLDINIQSKQNLHLNQEDFYNIENTEYNLSLVPENENCQHKSILNKKHKRSDSKDNDSINSYKLSNKISNVKNIENVIELGKII